MKKIASVVIGVSLLILTGYFTFAKDKTPDEIGHDIA